MAFGKLLADYRSCHGISQMQLASWVECSRAYISRMETGARDPSRSMTERVVRALYLNAREANVFRVSAGFAPIYTKGVVAR